MLANKEDKVRKSSCQNMEVGGQAVIEGVMMRSPRFVTVAVRKSNGEIVTRKDAFTSLTKKHKFLNIPIIRGAIALGETLFIGMRALTFSADIFAQEEEELKEEDSRNNENFDEHKDNPKSKKDEIFTALWLILTVVLGIGLALFLFFYLPLMITDYLRIRQGILFNLTSGMVRIGIFLLYIWLITRWGSMRRIFEYHGAEHKSIFALEAGENLNVEGVRRYSTHHPRCGTSFLLIVMLVAIGVYIFLGRPENVTERLIRLLFVPLIAGISYEIIKLSGNRRDNPLVRAFTLPGLWLQRLTTREPDDEQMEVAITALKKAIEE